MEETQALLQQLRDIHTPDVSWVPALGWWLLSGFLLLFGALLWLMARRRHSQRWRKEALHELSRLRAELSSRPHVDSLASASRLVRRVMLVVMPRDNVASLHGREWLEALDRVGGDSSFTQSYGRLLQTGPYESTTSLSHDDLQALLDVIETFIQSAKRPKDA